MLLTSCVLGLWLLLLGIEPVAPAGEQIDIGSSRLLSRHKRFMMKPSHLWPNAVLPYAFEESALPYKDEIVRVMQFIEDMSCVRFLSAKTIDRPALGLTYEGNITFYKGDGCFSAVGWSPGGVRTSCCTGEACLHEIGHALGFSHEQNDPKRVGWIDVNLDVVPISNKGDYSETTSDEYDYTRPYDITTMMHYFPVEFTKGKPAYDKSFPELSIAQQYFYHFKEMADGYQCVDKPQCQGSGVTCDHDGFLTVMHGKCQCYCPTGLDPGNGCRTPLKTVTSSWPKGQYALPMPKTGCPSGGSFHSSLVLQNGPVGNSMSSKYHLMGEVKDTKAELHFCTRTANDDVFKTPEGSKFNWPLGNYCVYMTGFKCPTGFDARSINYQVTTERTDGQIPAVTATSTKLCCQFRGFPKEPASFPTDKPFALIKYPKQKCQKVTGMRATQESYSMTSSQAFRVDPLFSSWLSFHNKRIKMPICYYRPVDMDCGGIITLSYAHPETVVSMSANGRTDLECTWVVKGDTDQGTLVLDFEEFDVKKEGKECRDKVEVRHAMIGQFGQEYCGEVKHSIRSITDKIIVRFFTNENSDSSFKAKIKWIPFDEMCYDVTTKGITYDGGVNYTRTFQPCLPWAEMTHCPHNPFLRKRSETLDNLEGNACRNPDNSFRPWCYTDRTSCHRNYCDVCGLEKPHDQLDYCSKLKDQGFCTADAAKAVQFCAATCKDLLPSKPLICPEGYTLFGSHCLGKAKSLDDGNYNDALEACVKEGGTVAAPRSQEEANLIMKIVGNTNAWIGINDRATEGRWVYEDGKELTWTNWNPAEPNNIGDEDAALMIPSTKWLDVPWSYHYHFACAVPKLKYEGISCGPPTALLDGNLIGTVKVRYYLGENVFYKCKQTDSVVVSRCMTSGQWSKQESACRPCPPHYTLYKNTCIGQPLGITKATYDGAIEECKKHGGTVATPKTPEEADLILKIANNQYIWIGITDKDTEGKWVYEDGSEVDWTNWDKSEPNNINNEDFAVMKTSTKWMDIPNFYKYFYACSFPSFEPSSCLDVLGTAKCESLLTDRPTLCDDYQLFARHYCRKSCGICQAAEVPPCPVATTNPGVVTLSPSSSTIPVGKSVKYDCDLFKYRTGGDSHRACLSSGKLSGEPLKCGDCPLGFVSTKGVCHGLLVGQALTFMEARAQCKKIGGFVALPKTPEEANIVSSVGMRDKVWIGVNDIANKNEFVWEDGPSVTWSHWAAGEPKTNNKYCTFADENKKWISAGCDDIKLMTVCTISTLDNDLCYDMKDGGASYDGRVSYTRSFQPCLPWTQVKHCPHNAFNPEDALHNLVGNACRNPDNSYRPWCYTDNVGCGRNYCDVCGNETPKDKRDDCTTFKSDGLCTRDAATAVKDCAATCLPLLQDKTPVDKYTDIQCAVPTPPSDGVIVGSPLFRYNVGHTVQFKCKAATWGTHSTCLTSGQWSKIGSSCSECPEGFSVFGGSCYLAIDKPYTYQTGVQMCKERGSSVAVPRNAREARHISMLAKYKSAWIGLSDEKTEGKWEAEDGSTAVWTNWNAVEPNGNRGENCIDMPSNLGWIDVPCAYSLQVVCAIPKLERTPCGDILADQCPQLLREEPTMCKTQAQFTRFYCAKTCGFCKVGSSSEHPEAAPQNACPVENSDPYVYTMPNTNTTSIHTGQYMRYGCRSNTHPVEGDEVRACLPNGTLTGEPLMCSDCPKGFKLVGNACHGLVEGRQLRYQEAKDKCESLGGFVAMPKSGAENDYIAELGAGSSVWIGATATSNGDGHDVMKWEDGTDFNWRNWAVEESQGDCVAMDTSGQWTKQDCRDRGTKTVCTLKLQDTQDNQCTSIGVYSGVCHKLLEGGKQLTYDAGVSGCAAIGGTVSAPRNPEEARGILTLADPNGIGKSIWLGINDRKNEGTWLNDDGSPLGWTNWVAEEPNNYGENGEDCAALMSGLGWMDVPCTYGYPVVCGIKQADSVVQCPSPRSPYKDETTEVPKTHYNLGSTVEYKCSWGPWTVQSRCMTDGQWSDTGHACLECSGTYANGTCYTLTEKTLIYDQAVAYCKARNETLAAPKNQEEATLMAQMMGSHQVAWVAITDRKNEGSWVYEKDGTGVVWTNWNPNEPNNYGNRGEDCAAMYHVVAKWIDVPCSYEYLGICAKELTLP